MGDRRRIEPGQQYQEVGTGFLGRALPVWKVEELREDARPFPLARLVCVSDRTARKTLSVAVLSDPRHFVRRP